MEILKVKFGLFLLLTSACLMAQDNYHMLTEQMLSDSYGLQNGEWVLFDEEAQNLNIDYTYGSTDIIEFTTTSEDFTQVLNILNDVEGAYSYDSAWGISNQSTIDEGDVCLLIVNMRKTNNVNDLGKVSLGIQAADNSAFENIITIQLREEWQQYLVPFQASKTYPADELLMNVELAWEIQEVEIAGINMMNFGSNYSLEELPYIVHNDKYGGFEPNASWRSEAAARIEANRKSDLTIALTDSNNDPLQGAEVEIQMLEHDFGWGTAIDISRIAGNFQQNQQYENMLLDLDGEGHKFNAVVPGSSFKWPGIEEGWIAPFEQKVNALDWLNDNDFKVRFHTLLWPGWINCPFDIEENADDPQYIIDRSNEWINFILSHPDLQGKFDEYDVINEMTTNRDFEMTFEGFGPYVTGREYYIEAINLINELVPDKPKVINDYITISTQQYKGEQYDFLQSSIQEIIDGGAPVDGIGFQAHINYFPTSIYEVESILTDFADKFDARLKITEYDIVDPRIDPLVAANYLDDFLTMVFSIPEVDMFMFWGAWDGDHWRQNGTLFEEDWSVKPAGEVFFEKLFNEWWTEENRTTDSNGDADFRAFNGEYEITVSYDGMTFIDTIFVNENTIQQYQLDVMSGLSSIGQSSEIQVYPNPSADFVNIVSLEKITSYKIYDVKGQVHFIETPVNAKEHKINISDLPQGVYVLELNCQGRLEMHKFEKRQ